VISDAVLKATPLAAFPACDKEGEVGFVWLSSEGTEIPFRPLMKV
jgi:hypothetical protein